MRERHSFTGARVAQPQNWCNFASGISGTHYAASFAHRKQVRTEVYLGMDEQQTNKAIFDALEKEKVSIEAEFGEPLRWERLDDRTASRVALYRPGSVEDDPETLREIQAWAVDRLLRFRKVFGPRLQRLLR